MYDQLADEIVFNHLIDEQRSSEEEAQALKRLLPVLLFGLVCLAARLRAWRRLGYPLALRVSGRFRMRETPTSLSPCHTRTRSHPIRAFTSSESISRANPRPSRRTIRGGAPLNGACAAGIFLTGRAFGGFLRPSSGTGLVNYQPGISRQGERPAGSGVEIQEGIDDKQ